MGASNNDPQEKMEATGVARAPALAVESPREPAPAARAEEPKKAPKLEDQIPLFWKLCSAALLSVTAMLAVTLYTQLSNSISSLRGEMVSIRERMGDLIDKDDYNSRNIAIAGTFKELQANNAAAQELWRERATFLDRDVKGNQDEFKQLTRELERLRERVAILESRQSDARAGSAGEAKK